MKVTNRVRRGVGGVFQPSLPETLIDLQFCCCFFFLQLSLLMLTFRRFYTKIHILYFCFFSPPSPNLFPCFSLSLLFPPTLHFTHGSCRWFSLTASLGLIICIQINYLITDKCPAATPHSGSSALSL